MIKELIRRMTTKKVKDKELNKQYAKWKSEFDKAHTAYSTDIFNENELVYRGTKKTKTSNKEVSNVRNISYELIEDQVNIFIPDSNVKSKLRGFRFAEKMIQNKLNSDIKTMDLVIINDKLERDTPMHGRSSVLLTWDNSKDYRTYVGDKKLIVKHPKQIIPQKGVYELQEMDYFFIIDNVTKKYVKDNYSIEVSGRVDYPDVDQVSDEDFNSHDNKVSMVTVFFKDDDGDVGKFVWANATPLEYLPKYYYPRIKICKDCGYENTQNAKECEECKSKKLEIKINTTEIIDEERELTPIVYSKKVKKVITDDNGNKSIQETVKEVIIERKLQKGDKVALFAPKIYPVIVRINTPLNFTFGGQSDLRIISDQQESYKKINSKMINKIAKSKDIVPIPNGLNADLDGEETYKVIRGDVAKLGQIEVKTLQGDVSGMPEILAGIYSDAEKTIGLTPSYKGQYDPSAKSGYAKQLQIMQTAGRFSSKHANKFKFFDDLYYLMFYFDVCFTDEKRPYYVKNSKGLDDYGEFDKYELLMKDDDNQWYYNVDFIIDTSKSDETPKDTPTIVQFFANLAQTQAISKKELFQILDKLDYPMAADILQNIEEEEEGLTEINRIVDLVTKIPPQQLEQLKQQPPDVQVQLIKDLLAEIPSEQGENRNPM